MGTTPLEQLGEQAKAHADAFGSAVGEIWKSMSGLAMPPTALGNLQADYLKEATTLWNNSLQALTADGEGQAPKLPDRRFSAKDWGANPASAYTAQMYLLNARALMQMAESLQGDEKAKGRVRFAVQQWIDAMSPSNFLALNPEAQRKALETRGESITQGLQHLWHDLQQGHVSQNRRKRLRGGPQRGHHRRHGGVRKRAVPADRIQAADGQGA